MIDADDLRDALIYGIQNAQNDCRTDMNHAREYAKTGKLSPDEAHMQTVIALGIDNALARILDKLTGDWPPSRSY